MIRKFLQLALSFSKKTCFKNYTILLVRCSNVNIYPVKFKNFVLQKIFDESRIIVVLPQKHIAKIKGILEHQIQFSTNPEETRTSVKERVAYVVMTKKQYHY